MATYYVDATSGSDSANGTSDSTPWKTIAKVNSSSFSAGDSILFKKGETWREQLTVPSSGSSGSPITFGAYGSGAKPIINGADILTGLTHDAADPEETGGIFASGFEDEVDAMTTDFTSKTSQGTNAVAITTTTGEFNNGAKAAKFSFDGTKTYNYITKTIADATTIYVRLYFKLNSNWAMQANYKAIELLSIKDGATIVSDVNLAVGTTWTKPHIYFRSRVDTGDDVYVGADDEIPLNTWHFVEVYFAAGTGANGVTTVWLNGNQLGTRTGRNFSAYAIDTINVGAGPDFADNMPPTSASILYVDDVKASATGPIGAFSAGAGDPANVWKKAGVTTQPFAVFVDNAIGAPEAALVGLNANNEWFWDDDVLYIYSDTDPAGKVVEVGQRKNIAATGKDYITIDGLHLTKANDNNIAIGNSDYPVITNCTIDYAGKILVAFNGTTNNGTISHSELSYSGLNRVGLGTGCGVVYANTVTGSQLFEHNYVHHIGTDVGDEGIDPQGGDGNITRYNLFKTITGHGVALTQNTINDEVYYNLFDSCIAGGIDVIEVAGAKVYNNTIYNSGILSGGVYYHAFWYKGGVGKSCLFKNNIIHTTTAYGIFSDVVTGFTSDYNVVYNVLAFGWNGTDYTGASKWTDYKTASSQDAHSSASDPLFVSTSDFHLQATSPCINAGANVSLTTDYAGNVVPKGSAPDIGAYEWFIPIISSDMQVLDNMQH
jgi:hypothetical protein